MEQRTVWVLIYILDYSGYDDPNESEVVGVFDSVGAAQASVPGAQWEQTKLGDYEAKGHQAHTHTRWFLSAYTLNEYNRPIIAPDHWEEL